MMEAKGKKVLRCTGMIEILFGITSLGLLFYALYSKDTTLLTSLGLDGETVLLQVTLSYVQAGIELIAGLAGVLLASKAKKYSVCIFFGYLLMAVVIVNFILVELTIAVLLQKALALLVPILYLYGAQKNKQSI